MKRRTTLLVLLLLLSFCRRSESIIEDYLIEVDFNALIVHKSDSTLIKSIRYLPLSLDKEMVISTIDKILFVNGNFYILDLMQNTIFVFNNDGILLRKLNKSGRGPGEYIGINCFDVDCSENVYIYDNMSRKIIKYDDDFIEYQEFKFNSYFEEFALYREGFILRNNYDNGIIKSRIARISFKNESIEALISKGMYNDEFEIPRFSRFSLFRSGANVFFHARFTNEIYCINSDGELFASISIDGEFPSNEFINDLKLNTSLAYTQKHYITDIRDIFENSSFITARIHKGFFYNILISKHTYQKLLLAGIMDDSYFGNNTIYGTANEYFISVLDNKLVLDKNWYDRVKKSSLPEPDKQNLLTAKIDDNPTLVLIEFKEF